MALIVEVGGEELCLLKKCRRMTGLPPRLIDTAMACHLAEPVDQVHRRLNGLQILVQVQKHVLSQIFRSGPVVQKMISDTEHHGLMLAHDTGKGELIPASRLGQCVFCGSRRS